MSKLKIALAQINTTVGDLEGNCAKILREAKKAESENCDLVVFCEMAICGYPCGDLWQKKYFILKVQEKIKEICEKTKSFGGAILLGAPHIENWKGVEKIYNAAFLIEGGEVKKIIKKNALPNYSVFDEKRYFESGKMVASVEFRGQTLAVLICEDLWDLKSLYLLSEQVFDNIIVINSSPFAIGKLQQRLELAKKFTTTLNKSLIYMNQVGAQDSLVFDGNSFVMNKEGEVEMMKNFEESFGVLELEKNGDMNVYELSAQAGFVTPPGGLYNLDKMHKHAGGVTNPARAVGEGSRTIYNACVLGLRDYIQKNGFKKVMLGMSGGVDSALVAAIAVDALGSENVFLYVLPSRYNSDESMIDAKECAKNLNVNLEIFSIEDSFKAMLSTLGEVKGLTKENLQARIRGNILMAISNETGALLLSTGNKSEMAMGYATLYGDMCGAFNPIKDLYKTQVYELVKWRNLQGEIIPQNIISKAPSAELRENQKDSDSLPEYEILDKILFQLIEEEKSVAEIIELGFVEELVKKIAKSFYLSEYKRKQAVLGPKISKMAFDLERRYPITNKFNS